MISLIGKAGQFSLMQGRGDGERGRGGRIDGRGERERGRGMQEMNGEGEEG